LWRHAKERAHPASEEKPVEFLSLAVAPSGILVLAWYALGRKTRFARCLSVVCTFGLPVCWVFVAAYLSAAEDPLPAKGRPEGEPAVKKLEKPKNWPQDHPLPLIGSNCAACHLTAGRELTAAVTNFVRSVHDLGEMTCYDCHGGNTRDDVKAHDEQFGFIGTKKSAHIKNCSDCHDAAAEVLAAGPHGWDFSKKINTDYPLCFDCHGNHDIGNPPADFKLTAMCADCHDKLDKQFPNIAAVVKENDRLWDVMRQVRKRNIARERPIPDALTADVAGLRADTMDVIHASKEVPADKAADLNKRAGALRAKLEMWLQSNP
jgi:hypothetical protein